MGIKNYSILEKKGTRKIKTPDQLFINLSRLFRLGDRKESVTKDRLYTEKTLKKKESYSIELIY